MNFKSLMQFDDCDEIDKKKHLRMRLVTRHIFHVPRLHKLKPIYFVFVITYH